MNPLNLYRWLAQALPENLKRTHGAELDHLTEQIILDSPAAPLFGDLIRRIIVEHSMELAQDVRYAFRSMRTSKLFTATAVASATINSH